MTAPSTVERAEDHPLAYCEFCGQRTDGPREACDDPTCQAAFADLMAAFRTRTTDDTDTAAQLAAIKRGEDR